MKFLIVEDSREDRLLLQARLRKAFNDAEFLEISRPTELMQALAAGQFDVVLTAYNLSWTDGLRVLWEVQARHPYTPVIMVTVSGNEEVAVAGMKCGLADYVLKGQLERLPVAVGEGLKKAQLRKAYDEAVSRLRLSEERYRTVCELTSDYAYSLRGTPDGRGGFDLAWDWLAGAYTAITGYSLEELQQVGPDRLVHPEDVPLFRRRLERLLAGHGDVSEYRIRTRGGEVRWLRDLGRPLPPGTLGGEGGEPGVRILGAAQDVTERRRLEDRSLQAVKMEALSRLAGGIAHDFANLLTAVLGYSTLHLESLPAGHTLRPGLELLQAKGEKAVALTQQLLALSRKRDLRPCALDLNAVVAEMQPVLRSVLGESIELLPSLDPYLPTLVADPALLRQMLLHLANHGRQVMPEGGWLRVLTHGPEGPPWGPSGPAALPYPAGGPWVLLAVQDSGPVLDAAARAHLFEPFFNPGRDGPGGGLDLATVYSIVQQSGGHIEVLGGPGQGTTFAVFLPCAGAAAAGRCQASAALPAVAWTEPEVGDAYSATAGETVLVAEDDEGVRGLVKDLLTRAGCLVLEAADGREALALGKGHPGPLHLLVTDLIMPQMSGWHLAERLLDVHPRMQVLYVSGYDTEDCRRCHPRACADAVLQKPFAPHVFLTRVRQLLAPRRRPEQDAGFPTG